MVLTLILAPFSGHQIAVQWMTDELTHLIVGQENAPTGEGVTVNGPHGRFGQRLNTQNENEALQALNE